MISRITDPVLMERRTMRIVPFIKWDLYTLSSKGFAQKSLEENLTVRLQKTTHKYIGWGDFDVCGGRHGVSPEFPAVTYSYFWQKITHSFDARSKDKQTQAFNAAWKGQSCETVHILEAEEKNVVQISENQGLHYPTNKLLKGGEL